MKKELTETPDLLHLFDEVQLTDIQNRLTRITKLGFVTVNYHGDPITEYTGFCDFCRRFRQDGELSKNCMASDAMSSVQAAISGKPLIYRCPCGLMEIAIPITVDGTYLGGFLCGQARCADAPENILTMRPSNGLSTFDQALQEAQDDLEKLPLFEYQKFQDIADLASLVITLLCENKISQMKQEQVLRNRIRHTAFRDEKLPEIVHLLQGNDYSSLLKKADTCAEELFHEEPEDPVGRMELLATFSDGLDRLLSPDEEVRTLDLFPLKSDDLSSVSATAWWLSLVLDYHFRQSVRKKVPVLETFFEYLNQHLSEPLTLSVMVRKSGISQSYLSRLIREQFQISVTDYIHIRKIMRAKMLIIRDGMGIADLAAELGYNEYTYFSKVFKKYEGITVQEYRKSLS